MLYVPLKSRTKAAPTLLATAVLIEMHDRVSNEKDAARAAFDLGWKIALGTAIDEHLIVSSPPHLIRAQLIVDNLVRDVFVRKLRPVGRSREGWHSQSSPGHEIHPQVRRCERYLSNSSLMALTASSG